jgi:hypothetical protein
VILAVDGITLPITHARLLVNDFRTFINVDTILNHASPLLPVCISLAAWFLTAQMSVQVSTISFVRVNVLVNDLMANLQAAFQLKLIGGLFRVEIFPDQPLDFSQFIR